MEVNEIRVGVIVKYNGIPMNIWSIWNHSTPKRDSFTVDLDSNEYDRHLKGIDLQELERIPLTTEWLIKGGCEKVNNSTYRLGTFTFQSITMSENYKNEDVIDRIFNSKKGFRICMAGKFIRNVFYVHDWQNFHYGISKQELTFN